MLKEFSCFCEYKKLIEKYHTSWYIFSWVYWIFCPSWRQGSRYPNLLGSRKDSLVIFLVLLYNYSIYWQSRLNCSVSLIRYHKDTCTKLLLQILFSICVSSLWRSYINLFNIVSILWDVSQEIGTTDLHIQIYKVYHHAISNQKEISSYSKKFNQIHLFNFYAKPCEYEKNKLALSQETY